MGNYRSLCSLVLDPFRTALRTVEAWIAVIFESALGACPDSRNKRLRRTVAAPEFLGALSDGRTPRIRIRLPRKSYATISPSLRH